MWKQRNDELESDRGIIMDEHVLYNEIKINSMLNTLNRFVDKLQDNCSRQLFDARFCYLVDNDKERFYRQIDTLLINADHKYACKILDHYIGSHPNKVDAEYIVFGAGEAGRCTARALLYLDKKILCFIDNDARKNRQNLLGIPILDLEGGMELYKKHKTTVIVSVFGYAQLEIYYQLISAGMSEEDILITTEAALWCDVDGQYFDLEELYWQNEPDGEVFVDCGSFDGMTSLQCQEKMNLKKVYAFEPSPENINSCRTNLEKLACEFELFECATWNCKDRISFTTNKFEPYASRINCGTGDRVVSADTIDNVLSGRRATYIKMDVEGSELFSLMGAVNTIKEYRPKLAISLYHNPEDIVRLPVFIEELDMDYKYYIRQYQTRMQETVLYAV